MAYKDDIGGLAGADYWWELDGDETDSIGTLDSDGGTNPSFVTSIVPAASAFQCGDYNGSNMVTDIPNASDINSATTTQKAISFWVDIDTIDTSGNGRVIWGEGGSSNGLSVYVYNNGGTPTLYFDIYVGSTHDTLTWTGVSTGTLYFITVVMDCTGGNMYIYVNGSQVASKTGGLNIGSSFSAHSAGVAIGGVDSTLDDASGAALSGYFDGRIADMIYVAETTPTTLAQHTTVYNSGLGAVVTVASAGDDIFKDDETNIPVVGTNFESAQGSGDVELVNNSVYASGTVFVSQSIDSWSDTSIQIDWVQGALTLNTTVYLFVTTDGAEQNSPGHPVYIGTPAPTLLTCEDDQIDTGENDIVLTGTDFESSQGTGKVELCNNVSYGSATIKVTQSIDTWGDTSIQFDSVQGTLPDGTVWIFVTTDAGRINATGYPVNLGTLPLDDYDTLVKALSPAPNHYWGLQNSYANDLQSSYPMDEVLSGTPGFVTSPLLCRGDSHSFEFDSTTQHAEKANSTDINSAQTRRYLSFWFQVDSIQPALVIVWEEGAYVNNICLLLGFGNILLAQGVDDGDTDVQTYSDFKLTPGRTYHVCWQLEASGFSNRFRLFLDGVEQARRTSDTWGHTEMAAHDGDFCLGWNQQTDNFGQLNVGGTTIAFTTPTTINYSQMANWTGGTLTAAQIRETLFEMGVLPDLTISSGTQSAMQTALDAISDTERSDAPCAILVDRVTGGGNLELIADNITFNPRCSIDVQWVGTGGEVLTWICANGASIDESKISTIRSGTVTVIYEWDVTITVRDASAGTVIVGARVLVTVDSGGDLPFEDSVTIARSGSVATVAHTAHGLRTGQKVLIAGAVQNEYNGVKTITVTGVDAYTFTVSGTPATPATGTITSTSVILEAVSDAQGEVTNTHRYTSDQPITWRARKGSSAIFYKTGVGGTTLVSSNLNATILLVRDQ